MSSPADHPADSVLWQEQVDIPALGDDLTSLPPRVDTVVVGGGYAGMAASRTLARAGRDVLVLEKERLGWGAHTRNGGMVIPELKAGPATLQASYGELGVRMYREVNQAFDHLEALIADEAIECDYERTGQLYLAHNRTHIAPLRAMARDILDEWRLAAAAPAFRAWLEAGAPSEDR